jgi:hypothetical protein
VGPEITLESQQRFIAERALSTREEVKSSDVSMVSHPNAVTKLVETGAGATM